MIQQNQNNINNFTTIIGLLNGMLGGTILIIPLLAIQTGYINTLLICFIVGLMIYYTAYLQALHFGQSRSIKQCILEHFNNQEKYVNIYNFAIFLAIGLVFPIYFKLIVLQIEGLITQSIWIAPATAFIIFLMIAFIRKQNKGQQTIAIGIISILIYIGFLIWAQLTAPKGQKRINQFGDIYRLTSSLTMGYSIHNFMSQNIFKNKNNKEYPKIIGWTYIFGIAAYTFIALGSFSIINRQSFRKDPETIQDYFQHGSWEVTIIELLYFIHLITVFPNFTIISKVRFYQLLNIKQKISIQWHEYLYILVILGYSYIIYAFNIKLQTLILLKGSILGYFYVYVIPIFLHFRCIYFNKSSGFINGDQQNNSNIILNKCQCDIKYSSKWTLYLQTFILIFMLIIGLFFTIKTLLQIFQ